MSSRKKQRAKKAENAAPRLSRPLLLLIGIAAVALVAIILLMTRPQEVDLGDYTPEVTGGPHLVVVSQETQDFGDVAVNTPVQSVFRIRNVGDQVLRILNEPEVELVRGC